MLTQNCFKIKRTVSPAINGGVFLIIMTSFVDINNLPIPYKYAIEAAFIAVILVVGILTLLKSYVVKRIIPSNNFTINYMVLSFILVFISTILAKINFGQPLIYGILASRRALYCLNGVILLVLLQKEKISLEKIKNLFVFCFVITLVLYYIINILYPPGTLLLEYGDEITKGFVAYSDARNVSRYRFDLSIILFGVIYSLLNIKNKKYLLYMLFSLAYIFFFYRGRILIASLFFIVAVYLLFVANIKTKIRVFVLSGIVIPLFFLLEIYDYESVTRFLDFFHVGINALLGEFGSDFSANSRIMQAETAWSHIQQCHYIGVGTVSHRWSMSPELLFGRLYPSDIGLLGLWFLYGVTGVLAFVYLSIRVGKFFFIVKRQDTFIFSCWLFAVSILFSSLLTGAIFITAFGQFSIMLAILTFAVAVDFKHAENIHNSC